MSSNLTPQQKLDKAYRRLRGAAAGSFPTTRDQVNLQNALDSFFIHYDRIKDEQLAPCKVYRP